MMPKNKRTFLMASLGIGTIALYLIEVEHPVVRIAFARHELGDLSVDHDIPQSLKQQLSEKESLIRLNHELLLTYLERSEPRYIDFVRLSYQAGYAEYEPLTTEKETTRTVPNASPITLSKKKTPAPEPKARSPNTMGYVLFLFIRNESRSSRYPLQRFLLFFESDF